ncbi:hypothetical protein ACTXT7_002628 [Hymenolepis weldensis]
MQVSDKTKLTAAEFILSWDNQFQQAVSKSPVILIDMQAYIAPDSLIVLGAKIVTTPVVLISQRQHYEDNQIPRFLEIREMVDFILYYKSETETNFQGDITDLSQEPSKLSEGKLDFKQQRYNIRYEELTQRMFELKLQDASKQKQLTIRKRIPSETIQIIKVNFPSSVSTPVPSCRIIRSTPKLKPGENPVVVSTNYNSTYQQPANRHPRYVIRSKEDPQIKPKTGQKDKLNRARFQGIPTSKPLYNMVKKSISNQLIKTGSTPGKAFLYHNGSDIETTRKIENSSPSSQTSSAISLTTLTQSSMMRTPKIQIDPPSSTQSPSIPDLKLNRPVSDDLSFLSDDSDTMTPIGENDKTITSPSISVNNSEKEMKLLDVPAFKIDSEISTPRRNAFIKPSNGTVYKKARLSIKIPSDASLKESLLQNLNRSKNISADESLNSLSSSSITTPAINDEDMLSDLGSGACDDQLTDAFDRFDSDDFNSSCPENIEELIQVCVKNTVALVPSSLSPLSERSLPSRVSNKEHSDKGNFIESTQISSLPPNSRMDASEGEESESDILDEVPTESLVVENSKNSKSSSISYGNQRISYHSRTNSGRSLSTTSSNIIDVNLDHPSLNSSRSESKRLEDRNNPFEASVILIKEGSSRNSTPTPISDADQIISIHSKLISPNVADQSEDPVWGYFIESPQINSPVLNPRNDTPEPAEDENLSCEAPMSVLVGRNLSFSAHSPVYEAEQKTPSRSRASNSKSPKSTLHKINKSDGSKTSSRSQSVIDGDEDKTSSLPPPRLLMNSFHRDNKPISESRFSLSSSVGIRTNSIQH